MSENAEEIPHWKKEMIKSQKEAELKKEFPEIGQIVRFEGETGIVLHIDRVNEITGEEKEDQEWPLYVRWDSSKEFDFEQHGFFDHEELDTYEFKYINMDGSLKK